MQTVSTDVAVRPTESDRIWLPGVLHVLAAVATVPVFGGPACVAGLLLASLASFVVYLPLTALALNQGRAISIDEVAPVLPIRAQAVLLALWTMTAWAGAALVATAS